MQDTASLHAIKAAIWHTQIHNWSIQFSAVIHQNVPAKMKLFLCVLVAALFALAACLDIGADLPPLSQGDIDCIVQTIQDRAQDIIDSGCSLEDIQDIGNMVSCYK